MRLAPTADEGPQAPPPGAPGMRRAQGTRRGAMSLRLRINLLITALMAVFAIAFGRMVVDDARSSIHEEIEAGTKVTVQMLSAALFASQVTDSPRRFIHAFLERLGRVRANHLRLRDAVSGEIVYESPPSVYKAGRDAPAWYARLVDPRIPPVTLHMPGARIEVVPDASRATLDAWDDLMHLMALGGLFFVLVNALVFGFVSRALRPMQQIRRALAQMEAGQVDARLPAFGLPELDGVGVAFNRMTAALREAMRDNRRLALAVRQSSDAILIHEPDGRIAYWNPAAERMFGYAARQIVGRPLATLAAPGQRAEVARHLLALSQREPVDNLTTRRLASDGRHVDVALSAAPLIDPDTDRVVGGIVTHRDIGAQLRAQAAEAELTRNREVAHLVRERVDAERRGIAQELHDELSQCVTAIRTIAESIIQRPASGTADVRAGAQRIKDIAARIYDGMHAIVRRLRPPELDVLGLSETLRVTVAAWAERNPALRFDLAVADDLDGLGEAVDIAVYRVVHEALTNAVRHARAAVVRIEVARGPGSLRIGVRDDGHGQVSLGAAAMGLGLLGMRERVEALGGRLEVDGRPGVGTELRATIPLPPA